jgi:hypothetical protein
MKGLTLLIILIGLVYGDAVYADPVDARYCGEPKRNEAGKIVRSITVRKQFEALYPLPPEYKRSSWQVDHVIPLKNGGCDSIINMQWLPLVLKICSGTICKDRWERDIYKR